MRLQTVKEFCEMLKMPQSRECRWRKAGVIPPELYKVLYHGKRKDHVVYLADRVEAWLLGQTEFGRVKHAEPSIRAPRRKSILQGNNVVTQQESKMQLVEHKSENVDGRVTEHHENERG